MSIDDLLDSLILPTAAPAPTNSIEISGNSGTHPENQSSHADLEEIRQLKQQLQKLCTDMNALRCENDSLKSERRTNAINADLNASADLNSLRTEPKSNTPFPWKQHIAAVEDCLRQRELDSGKAILKVLVDTSKAISCEPAAQVRLLTQLGRIQVEQGETDLAHTTLQQALALIDSSNSRATMEAAFCLDAMAQCYQQQNDFEQGEKLRRQAVVIGEELLGADHPDVHGFRERLDQLRQERNIAAIGQDEGSKTLLDKLTLQYNEALDQGQSPLNELSTTANASDSYSAFMVEKYIANGKTALQQKNIREAESQFRNAVDKATAVDNRDPRKTEALRLLAATVESQGKDNEARQLYESALTLAFQYLGWNDLQVAQCLSGLAEIHLRLGDLGLTKNYYQQAIGIYALSLGQEHETTVTLKAKCSEFLDAIKEESKWKGWAQ